MDIKPVSIILIGYRATGKTTVGKLLADDLGFVFVDIDQAIEQKEGNCISDMVAQHGWDYFRKKEKEMLTLLSGRKNHVIATGGGAILHQDIWPKLKQNSFIIWLKADSATICERLAGDATSVTQRPSLTGADIQQEVVSVLSERTPFYTAGCHLTLDACEPVEDIVNKALKAIIENPSSCE